MNQNRLNEMHNENIYDDDDEKKMYKIANEETKYSFPLSQTLCMKCENENVYYIFSYI